MPVYVYHDKDTGETFEVQRSIKDETPVVNPTTGNTNVERVPQPVAIAFKGRGFHTTDYPKARKTP